jgi:hypothetical protein
MPVAHAVTDLPAAEFTVLLVCSAVRTASIVVQCSCMTKILLSYYVVQAMLAVMSTGLVVAAPSPEH